MPAPCLLLHLVWNGPEDLRLQRDCRLTFSSLFHSSRGIFAFAIQAWGPPFPAQEGHQVTLPVVSRPKREGGCPPRSAAVKNTPLLTSHVDVT
jgi:hypothetical protein